MWNYDIYVNIAPIMFLAYICSAFALQKIENLRGVIIAGIFFFLSNLYVGIYIGAVNDGYGNIILIIIMNILFVIMFIVMFFCFNDFGLIEKLGLLISIISMFFTTYVRLRIENIIKSEWEDYFYDILIKIFENEWVKGIFIAASGGIISGLVVNAINKKDKKK